MGQSSWDSPPTHISTMKMFVVLAFAAAAVAEPEANADPQYLTYGAGTYLPYTAYGAYPYSTYSAYTPYVAFPYNTYNRHHFLAKREADAEADPALVYNTFPYTYSNVAPVVNSAVSPVTTYSTVAAVAPVVKTVPVSTYKPVASPVASVVRTVAAPVSTYHTVAAPVTTYASPMLRAVATPMIYNSVSAPNVVATPITYNTASNVVMPVARSNIVATTPLASNGAHAVAATNNGWTHSSNVGVCTNVYGFQVPC